MPTCQVGVTGRTTAAIRNSPEQRARGQAARGNRAATGVSRSGEKIPRFRRTLEIVNHKRDVLKEAAAYSVKEAGQSKLGVRHTGELPVARTGAAFSERLRRYRWVIERALEWLAADAPAPLHPLRAQKRDIWEAWHHLASALICLRYPNEECS